MSIRRYTMQKLGPPFILVGKFDAVRCTVRRRIGALMQCSYFINISAMWFALEWVSAAVNVNVAASLYISCQQRPWQKGNTGSSWSLVPSCGEITKFPSSGVLAILTDLFAYFFMVYLTTLLVAHSDEL
jgi:hypothetical protein